MMFGSDGILYITSLKDNSIGRYNPKTAESDILITSN